MAPPNFKNLSKLLFISPALDFGQFDCGVFINLQKAFGIIDDDDIFISKLSHYGVASSWF